MKPRLKLHADATVSLATVPRTYSFNCEKPRRSRHQVVANIRERVGSVGEFQRRFGVPHTIMQIALADSYNKGFAMGGRSGSLRAMLGLPVCSSANTKPLDSRIRIPIAALSVAAGGGA
jgi:hypothetical protein